VERLTRTLLSPWLLGGLLLICLAGAIQAGIQLITVKRHNELLLEPDQIETNRDTDPVLVFAKAHQLQQAGDPLEAIRLYGGILQQGDAHFRARVRYNLGTLYLRDAAKLWKERGLLEYVRINTLLSAAKDNLRESLALEPGQWDARYNLEYAYRITPPPKERPKNDFQGSKGSVFATLPTIPGGGP
jgi:mxaK protein